MDTLKIYREYKFKKGGSEFHISEGEKLKVRTDKGVFESVKIHCNKVIDIIPV